MSRIQNILDKAERDGATLRTARPTDEAPAPTADRSRDGAAHDRHPDAVAPPPVDRPQSCRARRPRTRRARRGRRIGDASQLHVRLNSLLVAALAPQSLAAEQYRSLRTRLAHAENGRRAAHHPRHQPAKGDGKSLTAANLALTMAQEFQQRVVLVDADLRTPSMQQLFGLPARPGLTDVLMGAATLDDALRSCREHHLTVLPAGLDADQPGRAARLGGDAPRARHAAHALRPRDSRHAAGRCRWPTCACSRRMVDGVADDRARRRHAEAGDRARAAARSTRPRCSASCSTTSGHRAGYELRGYDGYVAG